MSADAALGALGRVVRREPYAYRTSWPLDEAEIERPDGSSLRVIVKQLDGAAAVKPGFIVDPAREIEAYELLDSAGLGTPACYASGNWWLALEKIDGVELWQCGDLRDWEQTMRWAARLHARFAGERPRAKHLLTHDAAFYRRWAQRACDFMGRQVEALAGATDAAIARLTALPTTLVHGELYASNVIIDGDRVAVVDWEMAAIGPAVVDVAAVVTGWSGQERDALLRAYGEVDRADLAAARLLLALQWLGWAKGWQPPEEHRRDWLREARAAAEELT